MPSGKIKTLKNGFGFISPDDGGKDLFFHATELAGVEFASLSEGMLVVYETMESDKGPKAVQVRPA